MKKIVLAIALVGFVFVQTNAQSSKTAPAAAQPAKTAQVADPSQASQPKTVKSTVKKKRKVMPVSATKGSPATASQANQPKKAPAQVKENKDAAKPVAPGTDTKK